MECFQNYCTIETNCIKLIYEFMTHYEFTKTIPVFMSEAKNLGFVVPEDLPSEKPHIRRDDIRKIVSSFESKNYRSFFEPLRILWIALQSMDCTLEYNPEYSKRLKEMILSSKDLPISDLNTYIIPTLERSWGLPTEYSNRTDDDGFFPSKDLSNLGIINSPEKTSELNLTEKQDERKDLENKMCNKCIRKSKNLEIDKLKEFKMNEGRLHIDKLNSEYTEKAIDNTENVRVDKKDEEEMDSDRIALASRNEEFDMDSLERSIKEEANNSDDEVDGDENLKADEEKFENKEDKVKCEDYDQDSTECVNEEQLENVSEDCNNEKDDEMNESAMEVLKNFLTTKGPDFSSEPEFLPYFALPFINNPKEHPSFMEIFKESWASGMEHKLIQFVQKYSYGEGVAPQLMRLCPSGSLYNEPIIAKPTSPLNVVTSSTTQDSDSSRRYKNIKWKFQKLHKDHQNLIGVAAELTTALENSVRGQAVDLKATLNNCVKIFPELFSRPISTPEEVAVMKKDRFHEDIPCYHLDVQKIKQHLATGSIKAKLLLLQAIRWRLTRTTGEERDQTVVWVSQHDVLSLKSTSPVLEEMLVSPGTCTPHPLQQAAARLLNTVASLRCGRDYLAPSSNVLALLITTLRQDTVRIDEITADMLLATLQKLSLRKSQRLGMIEEGMVEWLIEKMKNSFERAYTLEYSAALLMNLCLHEEARQQFPPAFVSILIHLLDTAHTQVVPVVAGTLYCLLMRNDVNQVAKGLDLEQTILRHIQRFESEPQLVQQLETLLRLHQGEITPESIQTASEDQAEDEMEDPEGLERELDQDDPVRAMPGDLSGDELLNRLYSCPTSVHDGNEGQQE